LRAHEDGRRPSNTAITGTTDSKGTTANRARSNTSAHGCLPVVDQPYQWRQSIAILGSPSTSRLAEQAPESRRIVRPNASPAHARQVTDIAEQRPRVRPTA